MSEQHGTHVNEPAALDFERSEYESRLAAVQGKMAERGIELLVVSDPSNMCWLTGYDGWSFYVPQCVLVPCDDAPLWFGREMDINGARLTSYLSADRLIGYGDDYVQSPDMHPMEYLADIIKGRGWGGRTIALEMDNYYFSARSYQCLQARLADAKLCDGTALVNWQRLIKSPQELSYMRKAARIVEAMHTRAFEIIEPGMTKKDLAAEVTRCGIVGLDDEGGDYPAIVPLIATGREACAPHLTWDGTKIEAGSLTSFEIAGCYKRYHCPLARSIFLGKPPRHVIEAEKALLEASQKALEVARPGNRCEDIANTFFSTLRSRGFDKSSRCGYATGLSYPPDWGERTISLRAGDTSELRPGMTIHFMPGLWYDDWGLEITETILITNGAVQCLANIERCLRVKD